MKKSDKGEVVAVITVLIMILSSMWNPKFTIYFMPVVALVLLLWYSYGPKDNTTRN